MRYLHLRVFFETDDNALPCEQGWRVDVGGDNCYPVFQRPNCDVLVPGLNSGFDNPRRTRQQVRTPKRQDSGGLRKINVITNQDSNFEPVNREDLVIVSWTSDLFLEVKQMDFRLSSYDFSVSSDYGAVEKNSSLDFLIKSSSDNHDPVFFSDRL